MPYACNERPSKLWTISIRHSRSWPAWWVKSIRKLPRSASISLLWISNEASLTAPVEPFLDILRIHRQTVEESDPRIGQAHLELAEIFRRQGDLERAYEHTDIGRRSYEAAYAAGHTKHAFVYIRLGAIEFLRGRYKEALDWYKRALAVRIHHLGPKHLRVGYLHWNIAETQVAQGRHDEALVTLQTCEQIFAPSYATRPDLEALVASLRGQALLGLALEGKAPLRRALAPLEQAVAYFRESKQSSKEEADAYWALARVLEPSPRQPSERARNLARQALAIYDKQGESVRSPRHEVRQWLTKRGIE